jgi:hypothetical protein
MSHALHHAANRPTAAAHLHVLTHGVHGHDRGRKVQPAVGRKGDALIPLPIWSIGK